MSRTLRKKREYELVAVVRKMEKKMQHTSSGFIFYLEGFLLFARGKGSTPFKPSLMKMVFWLDILFFWYLVYFFTTIIFACFLVSCIGKIETLLCFPRLLFAKHV